MAGTRGISRFRGEQLRSQILRDRHFDENSKINENKVDIKFHNHREILEDTKVDVFVQVNNQVVQGLSSLDVTVAMASRPVATVAGEGIVTGVRLELRKQGTEDFPFIDNDGDRVYGKIRFDSTASKYFLDFFSEVGGVESVYTFASDAAAVDYRYVLRTNLSVIPVDALIQGGSGFVANATDAEAYMNLKQIMKDLYVNGTLDNDGNANLAKPLVAQISDEATARSNADTAILEDLASVLAGEGASLVGVVSDVNHSGMTVQAAITDLASRVKAAEDKVEVLQNESERFVVEAVGGETQILLPGGKKALPKTLFLSLNGSIQAPGINYAELVDGDGNVTGVSFAPETLKGADAVTGNEADVVFIWYKEVL
ncbi:hypothetical protein [Peribacillus frigoritolerans]|uniref:BppU N-terminal domain-containing protein n=1 Tax=Peribacillus castrilensis TaxID=2897690 RepID=A0AAW9NLS6_9BACI|nr:hypothetical protein [Peribacillus castrilensis]